jgi:hypothetical protein
MWLRGAPGAARRIGILPMLHGLEAPTLDHWSPAIALQRKECCIDLWQNG